jgi:hypothetical protein
VTVTVTGAAVTSDRTQTTETDTRAGIVCHPGRAPGPPGGVGPKTRNVSRPGADCTRPGRRWGEPSASSSLIRSDHRAVGGSVPFRRGVEAVAGRPGRETRAPISQAWHSATFDRVVFAADATAHALAGGLACWRIRSARVRFGAGGQITVGDRGGVASRVSSAAGEVVLPKGCARLLDVAVVLGLLLAED